MSVRLYRCLLLRLSMSVLCFVAVEFFFFFFFKWSIEDVIIRKNAYYMIYFLSFFQLKKKKVASCTFYTFLSFVSEFDVTCKLMNFVSSRRMVLRADKAKDITPSIAKDLNIKVITFLFSFSVRPHSLFLCNNKNNNTNNNNNNKIYSYFLSFFLPS